MSYSTAYTATTDICPQKAGQLLLLLNRFKRKLSDDRAEFATQKHLSTRYRLALLQIDLNPGISQNQLAQELVVTAAAISPSLKDLQKLGLIERRIHPVDGRTNTLHLTSSGQDAVGEISAHMAGQMDEWLDQLNSSDTQQFIQLLQKLLAE